jgi:hypothetical protein
MIPLAFLVAVAVATLAVLIVAAVTVGREMGRLGRTLARFEKETRPHLEQIERDARRAAERMEQLQMERLRAEQPSPPRPEG